MLEVITHQKKKKAVFNKRPLDDCRGKKQMKTKICLWFANTTAPTRKQCTAGPSLEPEANIWALTWSLSVWCSPVKHVYRPSGIFCTMRDIWKFEKLSSHHSLFPCAPSLSADSAVESDWLSDNGSSPVPPSALGPALKFCCLLEWTFTSKHNRA